MHSHRTEQAAFPQPASTRCSQRVQMQLGLPRVRLTPWSPDIAGRFRRRSSYVAPTELAQWCCCSPRSPAGVRAHGARPLVDSLTAAGRCSHTLRQQPSQHERPQMVDSIYRSRHTGRAIMPACPPLMKRVLGDPRRHRRRWSQSRRARAFRTATPTLLSGCLSGRSCRSDEPAHRGPLTCGGRDHRLIRAPGADR